MRWEDQNLYVTGQDPLPYDSMHYSCRYDMYLFNGEFVRINDLLYRVYSGTWLLLCST
jgi:hypothetical protein